MKIFDKNLWAKDKVAKNGETEEYWLSKYTWIHAVHGRPVNCHGFARSETGLGFGVENRWCCEEIALTPDLESSLESVPLEVQEPNSELPSEPIEQRLTGNLPKNNYDPVNHPSHYTFGKYEVIDVIVDWEMCYQLGTVMKYIARAGKKDPNKEVEDLKKAKFYLERKIELLEGARI